MQTEPGAVWVIEPATADRWDDLELLFGPGGGCGGCWCMWWRLRRSEFNRQRSPEHKAGLQRLFSEGQVPGLLAYRDGLPVGWCSVGPRVDFPGLMHSRTLRPLDERRTWSIVCFFVAKPARRQGLSMALLRSATQYALQHGAEVVEAYPVAAEGRTAANLYLGTVDMFSAAGFVPEPSNPRIWRMAPAAGS